MGLHNKESQAALLDNDQLLPSLSMGVSFPGFQELDLPSFTPTYKKYVGIFGIREAQKGDLGNPGDYSDLTRVANSYEYRMKGDNTQRTPS